MENLKLENRNPKLIIDEARTWLKTRWEHQGRLKGVQVDCAGLIIEVGKTLGLISTDGSADRKDYGKQPRPQRMRLALEEHMDHVARRDRRPGDAVWMRVGQQAQHLGILAVMRDGRHSLIHASSDVGEVEERPLDRRYEEKIVAVFRYRKIVGAIHELPLPR